jgi:predicted Zn-dependent protease
MLASTGEGSGDASTTNILHPVKTQITGMTRDGTFLIEKGKIARPLKNLRFTQSILEAFANVEAIGAKLKVVKDDWNALGTTVPAVKIRNFRFTGATS